MGIDIRLLVALYSYLICIYSITIADGEAANAHQLMKNGQHDKEGIAESVQQQPLEAAMAMAAPPTADALHQPDESFEQIFAENLDATQQQMVGQGGGGEEKNGIGIGTKDGQGIGGGTKKIEREEEERRQQQTEETGHLETKNDEKGGIVVATESVKKGDPNEMKQIMSDNESKDENGAGKNEPAVNEKNITSPHPPPPPPQEQQVAPADQQSLCPVPIEMPAFLRHQWLAGGGQQQQQQSMTAANFVRKMDSLEACARLCRENVEPFGGRHFGCHGFTYLSHKNAKNNICEFFDDHLAAALEKKPPIGGQKGTLAESSPSMPSPKNYFERICLPLSSRCSSRLPFAFEVYPRRSFVGIEPMQSEEVDDRKRCLEFCLQNERCRSVDFDTENLTCHLYAQTQHWMLGANDEKALIGQLVESVDLDHYENTCLLDLERCGSRHLAFVLIRNTELPGFSVGLGKLAISVCLTRCIDSPPAFCRSVQFRMSTSECFFGTERPLSPIPSDEMDIFEPICLPDPPSTSTLECLGEHVFERIPNMELRGDQPPPPPPPVMQAKQPKEQECLDACILDETCQSVNYRAALLPDEEEGEVPAQCRLFAFSRSDNRTLQVLTQNVDYYELACARIFFSSNSPNKTKMESPKGQRKEKETKAGKKEQKESKSTQMAESTSSTVVPTNKDAKLNGDKATLDSVGQFETTAPQGNGDQISTAATVFPSAPINSNSPGKNCTLGNRKAELIEQGRVLRMEHRLQHHVNVRNLEQCQRICVQAKALHCAAFAYSQRSRDCLLSGITVLSSNMSTEEMALISQRNPNFDLYNIREEMKCNEMAMATTQMTTTTPPQTTTTTTTLMLVENSTETEWTKKATEIKETTMAFVDQSSTATKSPPIEQQGILTNHQIGNQNNRSTSAESPKGNEDNIPTISTIIRNGTSAEAIIPPTSSLSPNLPTVMPVSISTTSLPLISIEPKQQQQLSFKTRFSPHQVHASAFCDSQGVNVTFRLIDGRRYSGVVYAADRFTQCRLFVDNESEFFFFVNRPNHQQQNWCNAQETNGQMSVMLVISNDIGVPLEVTTKDDLFFYISCNYAAEGEKIRNGIVVSGLGVGTELDQLQQHLANMEQQQEKRREDKRVKLKIMRNGMPVSNVYIGEHLVAVVESNDLNADTYRVAECNATRVPYAAERFPGDSLGPGSIPLLDHKGCSILPQIMGNMRRVADHFEASLTAFRIDGSSELDIICSVIICRISCAQQPEQCENNARSGRMASKQIERSKLVEEEQDKVTVDQRIRVLVLKEEGEIEGNALGTMEEGSKLLKQQLAEGKKRIDIDLATIEESRENEEAGAAGEGRQLMNANANFGGTYKPSSGDVCLNPLLLLLLIMLFILAISALFISLTTHWCRKKNARSNFYPTSTELSNHHFHIPRILDRAYMG